MQSTWSYYAQASAADKFIDGSESVWVRISNLMRAHEYRHTAFSSDRNRPLEVIGLTVQWLGRHGQATFDDQTLL